MAASSARFGASRVAAGIFLSRVLGFVRDRVFAHYFGNSPLADAWRAGLRLPSVLQNLLGEGALSASFIPVYVRLIEKGEEEEAGRVAGAILGLLISAAGLLALVGVLLAPVLVQVLLPGFDDGVRGPATVQLLRVLFPMMAVLVISAWILGILNSHRRFFVSYVAPVFWNVALLTVLIGGGAYLGRGGEDLLRDLGWGALIGGFLQFLFQVPYVRPYLRDLVISLDHRRTHVREILRNFVPVVAARGAVNLSSLFDTFLASFLGVGALSLIGYSLSLYLLPISLFGMSIAASELPELSRDERHGYAVVAKRAGVAVQRVVFWMIPSCVGYMAFGEQVMATIYQTGQFGPNDALAGGLVLAAYGIGLPASGVARVLSSTFFALKDTRTPARIAYMRIVTSVVIGASLMFPFDRLRVGALGLGAIGLALGASAGAWLECVLLIRAARGRLGPLGVSTSSVFKMLAAVIVAAGAGFAVTGPLARGTVSVVLSGGGTVAVFGVTYLVVSQLLGVAPWAGLSFGPKRGQ